MNDETKVSPEVQLKAVRASEITPRKVEWLWYPYIPFGKVTLLQGDPGDGKSQFALALAALFSRGDPAPFADPGSALPPLTTIYQTTEDDTHDTVVPRFIAAGGDRERLVFILEDEKKLSFADDRIREGILKYDARLLILDPLSSYIGDECSMNAANETRIAFNHIITVARETNCAILIIAHMNKARDTKPLYRTSGSIDIAGSARSILAIGHPPNSDNPNERVLVPVKSNLAPPGSAISFEVGGDGVAFLREMDLTASELFSESRTGAGRPSDRIDTVSLLIRELLKDGPVKATAIEGVLIAAGFRRTTIQKAKRNLGVVSEKEGAAWYWSLPAMDSGTNE